MMKNVQIKKILKSTVFKLLGHVNRWIPKDDRLILLYSGNKGLCFNLVPLKDYLIANGYQNRYRIICGIESVRYAGAKEKNVFYVTHLPALYYFFRTKHVFYTAGQIPIKPSKSQIVIHMNHGICDLKSCGLKTKINNGDEFFFTYILAPSELYRPIFAKEYNCPMENVLICGEPMTDVFYHCTSSCYFQGASKTVLWSPTFRQSDYLGYCDSNEELLPLFDHQSYVELNENLKQRNIRLIVKLHPAQTLDQYDRLSYSNLEIYSSDDFEAKGYDFYQMMRQVDALLGDYSSACLQFILLDKPIAFVVPDMEEYRRRRGFCFENPEEYMPGPLIKTREQLYAFFDKLLSDEDPYSAERKRVRDKVFKYRDGYNCKRLLKFSNIV